MRNNWTRYIIITLVVFFALGSILSALEKGASKEVTLFEFMEQIKNNQVKQVVIFPFGKL